MSKMLSEKIAHLLQYGLLRWSLRNYATVIDESYFGCSVCFES